MSAESSPESCGGCGAEVLGRYAGTGVCGDCTGTTSDPRWPIRPADLEWSRSRSLPKRERTLTELLLYGPMRR